MVQKSIPKSIQKVMASKNDRSLFLVDLESEIPWGPRVSLLGPVAFGTVGPLDPPALGARAGNSF